MGVSGTPFQVERIESRVVMRVVATEVTDDAEAASDDAHQEHEGKANVEYVVHVTPPVQAQPVSHPKAAHTSPAFPGT